MNQQDNNVAGQVISGYLIPAQAGRPERSLDIGKLLAIARQHRWLLTAIVVLFGASGLGLSMILPKIYRAEVLLAPAEQPGPGGAIRGLTNELGGLAALAGVDLTGGDRTNEYVAILGSRKFTIQFVDENKLMPVLFEKKWDADKGNWSGKLDAEDIPNYNDAFERFDRKVRTIFEDRRTGLVTLALEWKDPSLAADWANTMVAQLNEYIRRRDISEAEKSIAFLDGELSGTSNAEMRRGISQLIQSQVETTMLANVRPEYAFQVIDPAIVANDDEYVRPRHLVLTAIFVVLGLVLALAIVVVKLLRSSNLRVDDPESHSH